ncbi:MAG: hemerythrin family protein [Betaproteobacteria bacterium]|nr:hemerythrin family protein [Betaproteobacteria bacterium]
MDGVFTWSDDLSVGIEEIDHQHRTLIDILNRLFHAVVERKSEEVIGATLDALIDYTFTHFELEEQLMVNAGYDEAAFVSHQAAHKAFIDKVEGIARKSVMENKMVAFELINFLKHWLRDHICVTDKQYAKALRDAGYCTRQWEREARHAIQSRKRIWWKFWA